MANIFWTRPLFNSFRLHNSSKSTYFRTFQLISFPNLHSYFLLVGFFCLFVCLFVSLLLFRFLLKHLIRQMCPSPPHEEPLLQLCCWLTSTQLQLSGCSGPTLHSFHTRCCQSRPELDVIGLCIWVLNPSDTSDPALLSPSVSLDRWAKVI